MVDERCTFILQKPKNWEVTNTYEVYSQPMPLWANKIEIELKKQQLLYLLKLNPYYLRAFYCKYFRKIRIETNIEKTYT